MSNHPTSDAELSAALVPSRLNTTPALVADDTFSSRRASIPIGERGGLVRELMHTALDALDDVGDSIARAVGLR